MDLSLSEEERVDADLVQFLKTEHFPENIRDLGDKHDRFYEAAGILWNVISEHDVTYHEAMHQLERCLLETALRRGGQTRREIASRLKTSERTLYHRLRCHRLSHGRAR